MKEATDQEWLDRGPQYALAYDLAIRNAARDEAALDELRQRTGTLMAAAAIATSFLGAAAAQPSSIGVVGLLALIVFAIVEFMCICILLPRWGWGFLPSPAGVIHDYVEAQSPASLPETHRGLAREMSDRNSQNRAKLTTLYRAYGLASILLVVEVAAWVAELLFQ